jgi:hypothetical protein
MVLSFFKGAVLLNFSKMIVHEIMIIGVQQLNTLSTVHAGLHAWLNVLGLGTNNFRGEGDKLR